MDSLSDETLAADHLCVLVHGLWGNPEHLSYVAKALRERYPKEVHILVTKRNQGSFTYDGIELGAERVTNEIEETLEDLARQGRTIRKLSVIGYSLGGLIGRYAIGLLDSKGWFDKLEPVNFTTIATPHLGVRTPLLGFHNHIWNVLGARMLSTSGRQLFMIDSFRDTGRPLLAVLADPESVFIHALKKFKRRSLYANIVNDRTAVYYTTGLSRVDPFARMDDIKVNYIPGYQDVILDPEHPVSQRGDEEGLPTFYNRFAGQGRSIAQGVPIAIFMSVFLPVGVVVLSVTSAIQSVRSRQRIRLHEEGKAGIGIGMYRFPLMVEGVRRRAEGIFENITNTQNQDYLPSGTEELTSGSDGSLSPILSRKETQEEKPHVERILSKTESRQPEAPTLALTSAQFAIIQSLDDVGFTKYPVHIHKVYHSHAAIVVRSKRKGFSEGKLVIKHWLDNFQV